ncbi:tetratricopeptide repeat protein [Subtercola endophyticus]|uniref:tetratricopeptide repeat protein n=1 Tax=Subtercola endophyticus TaxID=2895559 RepID=UPI001E5210B5|nr:tetratricopeptide repeat protein [Subtercola endophyticus]UFS59091.1 tetratricopeptide repeat protein [Subtercola endophyticus]
MQRSNDPLLWRAIIYLESGRAQEAQKIIAEHLSLRPDDVEALIILSRALIQLDDSAGAVKVASRASSIVPNDARAWRAVAAALSNLNRYEEARDSALTCLRLEPTSWAALRETHQAACVSIWFKAILRISATALGTALSASHMEPENAKTWRVLATAFSHAAYHDNARVSALRSLRLDQLPWWRTVQLRMTTKASIVSPIGALSRRELLFVWLQISPMLIWRWETLP